MIQIPVSLPGLKFATILLGGYSAVWISLEGNVGQTILLGGWVTAVSLSTLIQNQWGGKVITTGWWVAGTAVWGTLLGLGTGILTLFFMTLKTGLHAHGPEFSPTQITWVIQQIPLWVIAGLLGGAGMGLITSYGLIFSRSTDKDEPE